MTRLLKQKAPLAFVGVFLGTQADDLGPWIFPILAGFLILFSLAEATNIRIGQETAINALTTYARHKERMGKDGYWPA